MNNKKDWDELEKWNIGRIQSEKEKSKFYFEEFNKNKKINNFAKGLNITGWIFRILAHIVVAIAIIIGLQFLSAKI